MTATDQPYFLPHTECARCPGGQPGTTCAENHCHPGSCAPTPLRMFDPGDPATAAVIGVADQTRRLAAASQEVRARELLAVVEAGDYAPAEVAVMIGLMDADDRGDLFGIIAGEVAAYRAGAGGR